MNTAHIAKFLWFMAGTKIVVCVACTTAGKWMWLAMWSTWLRSLPAVAWLKKSNTALFQPKNGVDLFGLTWGRPNTNPNSHRPLGPPTLSRVWLWQKSLCRAIGRKFWKGKLTQPTAPVCIHPTWCPHAWTAPRPPTLNGFVLQPTNRPACKWSARPMASGMRPFVGPLRMRKHTITFAARCLLRLHQHSFRPMTSTTWPT